jgi:K(+)-stimulated pyrophosphate-energized sodium pump
MDGEAEPDYAQCVDINTRAALKNLLTPGILAIAITSLVFTVY